MVCPSAHFVKPGATMPDKQGKLTQDEKQRIVQWLATTGKDPHCPHCGGTTWTLVEHALHTPIYRGGDLLVGGPAYPLIGVYCGTCGCLRFHSAVLAGIFPPASDLKEANRVEQAS